VAFPRSHRLGGSGEVIKLGAAPELFLIDAMTPFDLSVLLRAAWRNVSHACARLLDREREGKRELGAIVYAEEGP
jgi:hypothetical protein